MTSGSNKELSLQDLFSILRRRSTTFVAVSLVIVSLAVAYCFISTPYYSATGSIQVRKDSADGLGLQALVGAGSGPTDALEANIEIQTQASILQSDELALETIKTLRLEEVYEFQPHFQFVGRVLNVLSPPTPADPSNGSLEDSPKRRTSALKTFAKNLTVKPTSGTRLIEIRYLSSDRRKAADVVNYLMHELIEYNFRTQYEATQQVSGWLQEELKGLRATSEELQAQVAQMQRESGVYSLGSVDASGREQSYSATLDSLQQATAAVNVADENRILKEAIFRAASTGNAELISSLAGTSIANGTTPGLNTSLQVIQNLRAQEATIDSELAQAQAKFGPGYPKIGELKANREGIEDSLHQEVQRISARAQNDYLIAQRTEDGLKRSYEEQKAKADLLNDKAIKYLLARQEAASSRALYEDMSKHLKEAGIIEGLHSSNMTVVDKARISAKPAKPNVPIYLAAAIFLASFLGLSAAYAVDLLDNKLRGPSDIEALGLPLLGLLPAIDTPQQGSFQLSDPAMSEYSESVGKLAARLLLNRNAHPNRVILISSGLPGEGTTMLSSNLAVTFARQGKRVLLVESDLRRPTLRRLLGLPPRLGLSEMLSNSTVQVAPEEYPIGSGLWLLLSGAVPPHPSDLLRSSSMQALITAWRSDFDVVLLDGPPVLPFADALILSELSDTVVQLGCYGVSSRVSIMRSYELLADHCPGSVGIAMSGIPSTSNAYTSYYGYSSPLPYERMDYEEI